MNLPNRILFSFMFFETRFFIIDPAHNFCFFLNHFKKWEIITLEGRRVNTIMHITNFTNKTQIHIKNILLI